MDRSRTRRAPRPTGLRRYLRVGKRTRYRSRLGSSVQRTRLRTPDVRLDVGPYLADNVSFGPGARIGVLLGAAEARWRTQLVGEVTRFAAGDTTTWLRAAVGLRVTTSRNTAVLIEVGGNRMYDHSWLEGALRLNLYF